MQKFKRMPLLFGAFLLSFVLLGAGCQPQRHTSPIADYEDTPYDSSSSSYSASSDSSSSSSTKGPRKPRKRPGEGMQIQEEWEERTRELVLDAASVAKGTPYVFGGTSLSGFDCSGFVRWAYNAVGVDLPRSAREQSQFGQSIDRASLRVGDIVAFRHPKRGYHTGLYVGNGQFIHSPRRRDVVKVSSLTDPYFNGTYLGARRPEIPDSVDLKQVEKNVMALKAQKKAQQTASLSRKRSNEIKEAAEEKASRSSKKSKASKKESASSKKSSSASKKESAAASKKSNAASKQTKTSSAKKSESAASKKKENAPSRSSAAKARTSEKAAPSKAESASKSKKESAPRASGSSKSSSNSKSAAKPAAKSASKSADKSTKK